MDTIFECKNLHKQYGNVPALSGINLALPRGSIIGLLGPNGSGKTTLIKLAAGLLTPTSGEILVGGLAPGLTTKAKVSYLPDRDYLPGWMKVADLLDYFKDFFIDFDHAKAMDMLGRLQINPAMPLKSMSKGTREKVQLILTMSRTAELYLLDEPIGGVDPAARDYILETIITNYSENATVLLSTHLIADIERVLDGAVFINQGMVVMAAPVDEIRQTHGKSVDEYFREVFRC